MALQIETYLSGKIGNLVHYEMNGKHYSRMAPKKVKQSKGMKAHANLFGQASAMARLMRWGLNHSVPFPQDNNMQTRLSSAVLAWMKGSVGSQTKRIQDLSQLETFQFTTGGPAFLTRWKPGLNISAPSDNSLQINIPGLVPVESVTAPKNTISCKLIISALSFDPVENVTTQENFTERVFDYDNTALEPQTIAMELQIPMGNIVMVAASLEYTVLNTLNPIPNSDKRYMPAAIVKAVYL